MLERIGQMYDSETTVEIVSAAMVSIKPEKRKELFLSISSLINRIRHEKGCRAFRFYEEANEEDTFHMIGEWETVDDWVNHLNSEDFAVLFGCLEILGDGRLDFKVLSHVDEVEELIGDEANIRGQSETYDSNNRAYSQHV